MRTDPQILQTALSGYELLNDPLLNKGTAFSEVERDEFDLFGLLPPHVTTFDVQVERRLEAFRGIGTDLQKYIFLRGSQDTNETLFYALLTRAVRPFRLYLPVLAIF
jgi:malate dehydrogenase (oxaloacetate-decarboxylating)